MKEIILDDMVFNIVQLVSIILSIIITAYKTVTSTKKYELTENYRKEILQWYASVSSLMIKIIHYSENGKILEPEFADRKTEWLSQLSALTEIGRFYFPNVIKRDQFGVDKPSAYQGYRHINLEFLLYFYKTVLESENYIDTIQLWNLERNFTAVVFDMIDPKERKNEYKKYLELTLPKDRTMNDFICENSANKYVFERFFD